MKKVHPTIENKNAELRKKNVVGEFSLERTDSDISSDLGDGILEDGESPPSPKASSKVSSANKKKSLVAARNEMKKKIIKEVLDEVLPDIGSFDLNGVVANPVRVKTGVFVSFLKFFGLYPLTLHEIILTGIFDRLEKYVVEINEGKTPNPMLVNQADDKGRYPLIMCVKLKKTAAVRLLLHYSATVDIIEESTGRTALFYSAMLGYVEITQYLLDSKATVDLADYECVTPLMLAARNRDFEHCDLFCKHLADVDAQDSNGWTPLHYAASVNAVDVIKLLLTWGAHRDIKDKHKRKAIHIAKFKKHGESVSALEDLKARIAAVELEDL